MIAPSTRFPTLALVAFASGIYLCAAYANLASAVRRSADFRFFPPFKPHVDANHNRDLAAENYNIARSLRDGDGFANPFAARTGPTAWMPPILPAVLASLLWLFADNRDAVVSVVVFLQVNVLIITSILITRLIRKTAQKIPVGVVLAVVFLEILRDFTFWFQMTQDCWLVLLAVDMLLFGFCGGRSIKTGLRSAGWGVLGGISALVSPVVGLVWVTLTAALGIGQRAWRRLGIALAVAVIVLVPWTVRNYRVFGRMIPVKSNLAYELYQSQCLVPDGVLQGAGFARHPYCAVNPEGREFVSLGETAFLDHKWDQFRESVRTDPAEFLKRLGNRFVAATLWYKPGEMAAEAEQPWIVVLTRCIHPLPFVAAVVLLASAKWRPLRTEEWCVIALYAPYLVPYIAISYWERYAAPLLALKVLLILWASARVLDYLRARPANASATRLFTATAQG
jgi:hypothetical protein